MWSSVSVFSLSSDIRVYVSIPSLPSHRGVIIWVYVRIPSLPSHWGVIFRVNMSISSPRSQWNVIFRVFVRIPSFPSHWGVIFRVYMSIPSLLSHWGVIFRVYLSIPSPLSHWGVLFRSFCEPPLLSSDFLGVSQYGLTLRCDNQSCTRIPSLSSCWCVKMRGYFIFSSLISTFNLWCWELKWFCHT